MNLIFKFKELEMVIINKYYILVLESNLAIIFETQTGMMHGMPYMELLTRMHNGLVIENGKIENGQLKMYGGNKKYNLEKSKEKFIVLERITDNLYRVVNQSGKIKHLDKSEMTVGNVLNVKLVASRGKDRTIRTKVVPYIGSL